MKKLLLAWVGQNATFGTPHKVTGNYSEYGELYAFYSKEDLELFCDTYNERFNRYPHTISKKDARSKHLGMSVVDYEQYELNCAAVERAQNFINS